MVTIPSWADAKRSAIHRPSPAPLPCGLVVTVEQVKGRAPKHLNAVLLAELSQGIVAGLVGGNDGHAAYFGGLLHPLDLPNQQRLAAEVEAYFVGEA